jgi:tolkin protein
MVLLVSAEPGHILKLDFRNTFDLEYSNNCTYDYLEVRDGGHGYDRLIGLYCGKIFPDIIVSTSRYLWLRFKSDDTIEGAGFTAVYESILPSNGEHEICNLSQRNGNIGNN